MSDTTLIQRLRNCANEPWKHALRPIALEAADALEQQAAQIAEKDAEIARLRMLTCKCVENNTAANALRADADRLRAALTLSLVALTESVDSVRHEVNDRHEWYVGVPTRAVQLAGLDRWLADHEAAITAARAALRQEQPNHFPDAGKMVQPAGEQPT